MKNKFLPNLFIPGAAKSGTTTLHELLNLHPEISMSKVKEPVFWNNKKFEKYIEQDWLNYKKLFVEKSKICGESTTSYMYYNSFIENINKNYKKSPKFIFILRNPIDRYNSHFWWMKGLGLEKNKIKNVLNIESRINFEEYDYYPKNYFQFGLYSKWIQRFIDNFGLENIKVITLEKLISNRLDTINSCFDFLGLKKLESIAEKTSNKTTRIKYSFLYHFIRKSSIGKMNYTKIGKIFLSNKSIDRIKNKLKDIITNWKTEEFEYEPLQSEHRNHLKDAGYFSDVEKLKEIFDYSFNEWKDFN
ncbi:sulfotransferase domain-containing protein [Flavobacteriaceae bacterium]|nr:sulfotransferase domain-containing protein [Flavobacteriaceae bacterium]